MATDTPVAGFAALWAAFLNAIAQLLGSQTAGEGKFNSFRPWSQDLLAELIRDDRVGELQSALEPLLSDPSTRRPAELVLRELEAFNRYSAGTIDRIRRSQSNVTPIKPSQRAAVSTDTKENLGIGKTIVDSLKDMFEDLPPGLKILLKSLSEMLEIGKELIP